MHKEFNVLIMPCCKLHAPESYKPSKPCTVYMRMHSTQNLARLTNHSVPGKKLILPRRELITCGGCQYIFFAMVVQSRCLMPVLVQTL